MVNISDIGVSFMTDIYQVLTRFWLLDRNVGWLYYIINGQLFDNHTMDYNV